MLLPRHAARLLAATPAIVATLLAPAPSLAQGDASQAPVIESDAPDLPAAGATLDAYRAVDAWLRVGFAAPSESQPIDPAGTVAACVTVRLSGAVLGRATVAASSGDALWRAARAASLEALERAPAPRDATRDEHLHAIAQRATLDVQLAGRLTPLLGDTFADAALQINAGVEGVAMRVGESLALVFPGTALSTNSTPVESLRACAGQLRLPPVELATLRKDHNAIVYRFRVQHLVQPLAGQEPVFLTRGGRVVPPTDVSLPRLTAFANGLAARIGSLRTLPLGQPRHSEAPNRPVGFLGDFHPWTGAHDPLVAPPRDQALALYALARYTTSPAIDAASRARVARAFWEVCDDAGVLVRTGRLSFDDPVAAAFFALALNGAPERPPGAPLPRQPLDPDEALRALNDAFLPDGGWRENLRPGERSAIALAIADAARRSPDDAPLRARATEAVRSLFREATPGTMVAYMPWLLDAELALAGEGQVPSMAAILELRDLIWRHQLTPADAGADNADLVGGIVFTASCNPLPTAQLTRPLAALARMTFDRRFTPSDEFPAELARLTASLRFLRQLAVDDPLLHMMQDERACRWGIRASPWDMTLPLDASAMALLTLIETLDGAQGASGAAGR